VNKKNYNLPIRCVSSLSPLAAAFNTKQNFRLSSMLDVRNGGLFNVPELSSPEGFQEVKEKCKVNSTALVNEVCDKSRKRNVVSIFDDLSDELCRVADLSEFIRLAHPDQSVAIAAQDACIEISALVEKLNTNIGIYSALQESVEHGDKFPSTEVDRRVSLLFLQDFQQCGIHLPEKEREKVVELTDSILRSGQLYAANCQDARYVKTSVLPPQVKLQFQTEGDYSIISGYNLDTPSDMGREAAYKIYYWREQQQDQILAQIIQERYELAKLCGYKTFSHRALSYSLVESPENLAIFHQVLGKGLPSRVKQDHEAMLNMKKRLNPLCQPLAVWDVPYYSHQAKSNWFKLDIEKVSEYFSLGVAMEGLNDLFKNLYGVRLEVCETNTGELWSSDVFKLGVIDKDDKLLGYIYCDFFSRQGKPCQDCHFTIRGGRQRNDGSYQDPVVVLMLNLPPPGWKTPTLLSPSALDNLFHEMGHAMHSMLGRTKYQHVTGTRCSTDFAEVPSTLMEYFVADPRVLSRINAHYRTGEKLPDHVIEKLCATKKIFSGVELQAQLVFSAVDQEYHGELPLVGDSTDVYAEVHRNLHSLPYVENTAPQLRFSHLVGYGARYYSYLIAKSVASAIWQENFQQDPFSTQAGMRYRDSCLSHGGGKPSLDLVSEYLQHPVEPHLLALALLKEVDEKNETVQTLLHKSQN